MPKNIYVGVDNISRLVKNAYTGINGKARKISKGYVGVNGIARLFFDNSENTGKYALLYNDGLLVFQNNPIVDNSKNLSAFYSSVKDSYQFTEYIPWCHNTANIKNVLFNNEMLINNTSYWFHNAQNLISVNSTNLDSIDMSHCYYNCRNLIDPASCGKNVTNMSFSYSYCTNLIGSPICGQNVIDMTDAYSYCYNLTGAPVCGEKVNTMRGAYYCCYNLTGSPVCGQNVTNMMYSYALCNNLTGFPVCGDNVTSMAYTYKGCVNLTGSPVCKDSVISMYQTYYNCQNLTGYPICGKNVTNMSYAYYNCKNLTGSPTCNENVTNMSYAYCNCKNLATPLIILKSNNITNMYMTYCNCKNLFGNMYLYSPNVSNFYYCFNGRDNTKILNIYVPASSNTQTTLLSSRYLSESYCSWTNDASNNRYYNTTYNIFIYPVENVASVYESSEDSTIGLIIVNKPKVEYYPGEEFDPTGMTVYLHHEDDTIELVSDYTYSVDNNICTISYVSNENEYTTSFNLYYTDISDFQYTDNGDNTYTLTEWNGTLGGNQSTKIYIPDGNSIIL